MDINPISLPLYLDYQASTPMDARVEAAMAPYWNSVFGNPHSATHGFGLKAAQAIEEARAEIASLLTAKPHEIIFTSGATDSSNLALLGTARAKTGKRHIISVATEHESVLQPLKLLEKEGVDITLLPVDRDGLVELAALENSICTDTMLVSVMTANNETGVCQDIDAIGKICARHGVAFHTDAAQALTTRKLDTVKTNLTFASLSGHKLYGPMGIGALYIRDRSEITPLIVGGAQERGLRAGTLPTALCVGLGAACRIAGEAREKDAAHLQRLTATFHEILDTELTGKASFNGNAAPHIPGCLSVTFAGIDAEDLLHELPQLALSTGSACSSRQAEPSHVLLAMGRSAVEAAATVRIGFGRSTSMVDVQFAAKQILRGYWKLNG
ncbi:MAG: cysteine desulfurase [Sneathiella sp.]|nr:cysteine desulfurase [Sneathiella sp.]